MATARKTSTPPGAIPLSNERIAGVLKDIRGYMDRYLPHFHRCDTGENATEFVLGLLSKLPRKSAEPISEIFDRERKVFQRFVGDSPWDDSAIRAEMSRDIEETIGDPCGVLCLDPSGFPKKGEMSVGVASQWCGRLGKTENCQVGVFVSYATPKGRCLVDCQLFLPEKWVDDEERRKAARVPKDRRYLTHIELASELLLKTSHIPHAGVLADAEFGRDGDFRDGLYATEEIVVLAVPSNLEIRIVDRGVVIPAPHKLSEWVASRPKTDWVRVQTRIGSQGPMTFAALTAEIATLRDDKSIRRETLLVFHPVESPKEITYAFVKAPPGTDLQTLIQIATRRWTIEDCFERAKTECGMDQYEVRSWVGWHHHMTMSMLALWFLVKLNIAMKGDFPPSDSPVDRADTGRNHIQSSIGPLRAVPADSEKVETNTRGELLSPEAEKACVQGSCGG